MREKGQTEAAKTLETPVFSRGIEILTEKLEFEGIVISVMFLVMIEASCPLVIWFEYHFT